MNFVSKIFGGNAKAEQSPVAQPETHLPTTEQGNAPPSELFLDDEQPLPNQEIEDTPSRIKEFLDRNFHSQGVRDGYDYHSKEALDNANKKIKAEFLLIVDQVIQQKNVHKLSIRNLIIDVNQISETTTKKLENTTFELEASITLLQKQKDLSIENEGWVMVAIHGYRQGFIEGMETFVESDMLIKSVANI
jgi:hypothetical protein